MKRGTALPCCPVTARPHTPPLKRFLWVIKVDILSCLPVGHPPTFALTKARKLSDVIDAGICVNLLNLTTLHSQFNPEAAIHIHRQRRGDG